MRDDAAMTRRRHHHVAVLVDDGVAPFEMGIPCEVFGYDRDDLADPWYKLLVCSVRPGPVRSDLGFTLETPHNLDDLRRADTVIVPVAGSDIEPGPEVIAALRSAHDNGARMVSLCTGAFVLAAAGLLDGRRATTHWRWSEELQRRYPTVRVDRNVLYVDDGEILTSAGTAAGLDLCLHIVRRDHGAEVANALARRLVIAPHRDGGQAQFVDQPMLDGADGDLFGETLGWMEANIAEPLRVSDLAQRAAMSPRTFARRFRSVTGTTPHQWLLRQRVLHAQRLLETTDEPVDVVAHEVGFGSAAHLRQHFARILHTSPATYRRSFTCRPQGADALAG